ncbi:methyltransferase domain-containing protein [Streptomyces sp. N2-109]|uniref:Methyltransferase domain-containing protein n=1 Tax=Streptomyces gossypii TaxID=2883101 RepID=A0ABT2JXB0_9ACTN|nr:class I SAM-dependent methyltransferase [Streptomyces gossypii]MCT2592532.1 methyltransferase domain-containing protein [Streptomyces gossypii]
MPEKPTFALEDVDFEATYQGKPPVKGKETSFGVTPWDIGEPQPLVVELERSGQLKGEILDAGCGLGENALFLAGKGHRVTGIDAAQTALDKARRLAEERDASVEFVRSDATTLTELDDERFTSVLDSTLYHCLTEDKQRDYAAALHRVTKPGAQLHLFCFADTATGFRLPQFLVSRQNLRTNLGPHWDIHDIRPAQYTTSLTRETIVAMDARFADIGISINPDEVEVDEQGRVQATVWHLHATRR